MNQNINEANSALTQKPLLATSAERLLILNEEKNKNRDLPQPLRFSKMLAALLSRVSTPIKPYDIIAGRCVDRVLDADEEQIFQDYINDPLRPEKAVMLSAGHCSFSWDSVVKYGLCGLFSKVKAKKDSERDPEKQVFLTAMCEVYGAVTDYILRYADAAKKLGMRELEQSLVAAATRAPDSFLSALQLLWIITLIDCAYITPNPTLTVGRLDKILYPLYRKDTERGTLTRERAKEIITDYYCKHNLIMGRGEHQVGTDKNSTTFDRILAFDAPQYLLLCGTDVNGRPEVNELSQLFSECIVPGFKNPVVVVRYYKNMDKDYPQLWQTLVNKALDSSSLMFYNDTSIKKTYARFGIPAADADKYEHFGCNWPSLGPDSAWMQIGPRSKHFNAYNDECEKERVTKPYMRMNTECGWPEDFMEVFFALTDKKDVTIEDFYRGFFERMGGFIDRKLERMSRELEIRRRRPSAVLTFGDCFWDDAIQNAECHSACAKYHFELQAFQMFGTVADCFITVDKLVFIDKRLSLCELYDAVKNDFCDRPDILALCRGVEKYGSDTPHSNAHVKRLSDTVSALVIEKSKPYLEKCGLFLTPCMQSDTWHLKNGEMYGATPDGRRAGAAFSQNTRPSNGACINGITAMLNSMLCIGDDNLLSGALNLDIDKSEFAGKEQVFAALLASYFNRGGLHAQISTADAKTLVEAKARPESHRDIRVRVTGYSGVFVDLPENLQDDVINRFK